jgi:hypothetical protein
LRFDMLLWVHGLGVTCTIDHWRAGTVRCGAVVDSFSPPSQTVGTVVQVTQNIGRDQTSEQQN